MFKIALAALVLNGCASNVIRRVHYNIDGTSDTSFVCESFTPFPDNQRIVSFCANKFAFFDWDGEPPLDMISEHGDELWYTQCSSNRVNKYKIYEVADDRRSFDILPSYSGFSVVTQNGTYNFLKR